MVAISVTQSTFERLQKHAIPLVDSIESVINRLIDEIEQRGSVLPSPPTSRLVFGADRLPNVTHTTVVGANFGGNAVDPASWKSVLNFAIGIAAKRGIKVEELKRITGVRMTTGKKEDEGFTFLTDVNISVQGQDALAASRAIVRLAQHLKTSVEISFYWQEKEAAEHPGQQAMLKYDSKS